MVAKKKLKGNGSITSQLLSMTIKGPGWPFYPPKVVSPSIATARERPEVLVSVPLSIIKGLSAEEASAMK